MKKLSKLSAGNDGKPTGRPSKSNQVRVVPIFRKEIDIRRLGQAALRLAMEKSSDNESNETYKNNDNEEL